MQFYTLSLNMLVYLSGWAVLSSFAIGAFVITSKGIHLCAEIHKWDCSPIFS